MTTKTKTKPKIGGFDTAPLPHTFIAGVYCRLDSAGLIIAARAEPDTDDAKPLRWKADEDSPSTP